MQTQPSIGIYSRYQSALPRITYNLWVFDENESNFD